MTKIFISYSSKNRDLVKQLADDLEFLLYDAKVWYDAELLRTGGQLWWDNILAQIRQCDIFIYAASPQILHSEPCRREYQYAKALGKPVLPVTVAEVEIRHLPLELQAAQIVSFLEQSRQQQKNLRDSILNLPRGVPLPDDPADWPTPPPAPLDPVGVLFDKISRLTTDGTEQRTVFLDIEDLSDDSTYKGFAPELLRRFIARDDVLIARNLRRAEDLLAKLEPLTPQPPRPQGVRGGEGQGHALQQGAKESETLPVLKPTAPPPTTKPDPVQEALARARKFISEGKKNSDWKPFYVMFRDVKIPDMQFCLVPTGKFMMGTDNISSDKKLIYPQVIEQPFYIARYPVTNAQWQLAVKAGAVGDPEGENALKWYKEPKMANAPVVGVNWFDCQKFAVWVGCGLPTEREWEYSARGIETLRYPWGNDWEDGKKAVWKGNSGGKPNDVTTKTDGASWVGALHLSGNVWEWTASLFEPYPYAADGSRERSVGNSIDVYRVSRGGSWADQYHFLRAIYRDKGRLNIRVDNWGLRLARSS